MPKQKAIPHGADTKQRGSKMKKFIRPIKKMEELVIWQQKVKEIAPLTVYSFFVIALDTGISPEFLLQLKWADIKQDETGAVIKKTEPYFDIYCECEKVTRKIYFCDDSLAQLNELRLAYPDDVYIFQSHAVNVAKKIQPMKIFSIGKIFKDAAKKAGLPNPDSVSALTLRKTFGYMNIIYNKWSIHQLRRYFDQKHSNITRKYIDLTTEVINTKHLPRKKRKQAEE